MTREEAIDVLKTETCYECTYGCMSTANCENGKCPFRKAVLMAIEALEQEPKADNRVKPEIDRVKTELGDCITIDGIRYIAEEPKLKTVHKDGEVVIGGFREVQE